MQCTLESNLCPLSCDAHSTTRISTQITFWGASRPRGDPMIATSWEYSEGAYSALLVSSGPYRIISISVLPTFMAYLSQGMCLRAMHRRADQGAPPEGNLVLMSPTQPTWPHNHTIVSPCSDTCPIHTVSHIIAPLGHRHAHTYLKNNAINTSVLWDHKSPPPQHMQSCHAIRDSRPTINMLWIRLQASTTAWPAQLSRQ